MRKAYASEPSTHWKEKKKLAYLICSIFVKKCQSVLMKIFT